MGLGPIPWSAMILYASHLNLDGPNTDNFVVVIKAMDNAYLEWHEEQAEKASKQRQQPQGNKRPK